MLLFQFFDRPTNNRINKIDNQCDIKYIPNLSYDINYKIDVDNIGILNYILRQNVNLLSFKFSRFLILSKY